MIYFIKTSDDQYVKIGYSLNDIKSRLSGLQTGNPLKLEFVGWCEGDMNYEKILHSFFKEYKTEVDNEWFQYSDKIRKFIKSKTDSIMPQCQNNPVPHKCRADRHQVDSHGWFLCECGKRMIFAFPIDNRVIQNFGRGTYWRERTLKYGRFETKIHGNQEEFVKRIQKQYEVEK